MKYTTTKCRHCGYATRCFEGNVPKVQIGSPIIICPRCGNLILDSIITEFEFMTIEEKEKFSSELLTTKSTLKNIFLSIFGLILFIGSMFLGGWYIAVGIIFGIGMIAISIIDIVKERKLCNEEVVEQAIYESLQRTKNMEYVQFIQKAYETNKLRRNYTPFSDRNRFMKQYEKFEYRSSYKENMEEFNQLLELLKIENQVNKSKDSTFNHHWFLQAKKCVLDLINEL